LPVSDDTKRCGVRTSLTLLVSSDKLLLLQSSDELLLLRSSDKLLLLRSPDSLLLMSLRSPRGRSDEFFWLGQAASFIRDLAVQPALSLARWWR
jgi:hypothetical protein